MIFKFLKYVYPEMQFVVSGFFYVILLIKFITECKFILTECKFILTECNFIDIYTNKILKIGEPIQNSSLPSSN